MKTTIVTVYSVIHLVVDMCCALLIAGCVARQQTGIDLFWAIVLYDFLAFVLQLPIGMLADKWNKNALVSAAGCVLVAAAFLLTDFGWLPCIVAGIGNALFHVGGGIDVLHISEHKAAPSGIFVSTGALGLFLGAKAAGAGFSHFFAAVLLLLVCFAALMLLYANIKGKVCNLPFALPRLGKREILAVVCLMATVFLRSYVGMLLSFEWKSRLPLAVAAVLGVVLGKMGGGLIGDRIGFRLTAVLSLGAAAVGFLFAFRVPAIGIAAILLFNMTMPLTLTALADLFENAKGTAFGLLTVMLFCGTVPKMLGWTALFTPWGLAVLTVLSAVLLVIGLPRKKENAYAA